MYIYPFINCSIDDFLKSIYLTISSKPTRLNQFTIVSTVFYSKAYCYYTKNDIKKGLEFSNSLKEVFSTRTPLPLKIY